MKNTYTFTARSSHNPAHVATFTLHDGRMDVGIGASLSEVEKLLGNGEDDDAHSLQDLAEGDAVWVKPAAAWLAQRTIRPFSVADVEAEAFDEGLQVKAWIRAGGRRLLPVTLGWDRVDNPEASQAFVDELHDRQVLATRPGQYPRMLDYWITWLVGGVAAVLVLVLTLRRLGRVQEAGG